VEIRFKKAILLARLEDSLKQMCLLKASVGSERLITLLSIVVKVRRNRYFSKIELRFVFVRVTLLFSKLVNVYINIASTADVSTLASSAHKE
jgi:hypothetical protein